MNSSKRAWQVMHATVQCTCSLFWRSGLWPYLLFELMDSRGATIERTSRMTANIYDTPVAGGSAGVRHYHLNRQLLDCSITAACMTQASLIHICPCIQNVLLTCNAMESLPFFSRKALHTFI